MPADKEVQDPISAAIRGFIRSDMQGSLRDGFMLLVGLGAVAGAPSIAVPESDFMFYAGIVLTIWGIVAPVTRSVLGILRGTER